MNQPAVKGSCLCGEVEFEFVDGVRTFQYCHCSRCRKFTGAAHAANLIVTPDSFRWTRGEESVGRYEVPEATYHATAFCKKCGSSLPWRNKTGSAVIIPAGTLDPKESPINCAKRELIEETGYSSNSWRQLGTITPLPGCSNERIHIFLAANLQPAKQALDKDELLNVHSMELKKAVQMILSGEINDGKTIAGLFLALNWLKKNRAEINY